MTGYVKPLGAGFSDLFTCPLCFDPLKWKKEKSLAKRTERAGGYSESGWGLVCNNSECDWEDLHPTLGGKQNRERFFTEEEVK